ncbi:hypothetical protein R3I94_009039 [Phoxinus phoxinus]
MYVHLLSVVYLLTETTFRMLMSALQNNWEKKREKGHQSFVQSVSTCLNVVTQHSIYLAKNIFSFTSPVGGITTPPLSTELRNPRREGSGQADAESTRPRPDCIRFGDFGRL